jgi:hypothetical protein
MPTRSALICQSLASLRGADSCPGNYQARIGLELLCASPYALTFKCGSTQLTLSKSTIGTSDEQTQASGMVEDHPMPV